MTDESVDSILKRRLALGEIDVEEYKELRATLAEGSEADGTDDARPDPVPLGKLLFSRDGIRIDQSRLTFEGASILLKDIRSTDISSVPRWPFTNTTLLVKHGMIAFIVVWIVFAVAGFGWLSRTILAGLLIGLFGFFPNHYVLEITDRKDGVRRLAHRKKDFLTEIERVISPRAI